MKTIELNGQVLQAFGNGSKAYLMDVTETYTKKVIVFANSEEEANEEILTADYEMTAEDYLSDSMVWEEPIDVTEDIEAVNFGDEAKKPFVRLTISNWRANKKFQEATNLRPTHQFDGFFDYDDLDMHDDMATVIRTLGQLDSSSYYFTTEQP